MENSNLLVENMRQSHRRLLFAAVIILILSNLAAIGLYLAGISHTTVAGILREVMACVVIVVMAYIFIKKYYQHSLSKYISVAAFGLIVMVFNCSMPGAPEIFADFYMVMGLALLYFDVKLSVFSTLLVLLLNSLMLYVFPQMRPEGLSNLGVRYFNFIFFGLVAVVVSSVASGLLKTSITKQEEASELSDNLGNVAAHVTKQAHMLAQSSAQLLASTQETGDAAQQVSASVSNMAEAATEEALHAGKTTEVVRQMANALNEAGNSINRVNQQSEEFRLIVDQGLKAMSEQSSYMQESNNAQESVGKAVDELKIRSRKIVEIVELITSITNQTNLLALNAAIEAARAGDAGKGFAVVAEEVRKLAEESGKAALNISDLVNEIQQEMGLTVKEIEHAKQVTVKQNDSVEATQHMFARIEEGARQIDSAIQEVSAVLEEMLASTDEVVSEVESISASTEESAASSQEVTALVEQQAEAVKLIIDMAGEVRQASDELKQLAAGFNGGPEASETMQTCRGIPG
jgi:methyl-accepting chemotaxis protein